MDDIIVVRQLPVIEERLKQISEQIQARVSSALALNCTEETVKEVKKVRADLSKDFRELEEKRKQVKSAILAPYEHFESVYKDCVTDIYRPADGQLKEKISEVEDGIKGLKREETAAYFAEYAASKGIDFLKFDDTKISVTLSASKKALKEQARDFVDKVADDLAMIETQECAAEILVEYKQSLNVSQAILTVTNRQKAIETERQRAQQAEITAQERAKVVQKVEEAITQTTISAPTAEPVPVEETEEKQYFVNFTVHGTIKQLKALKAFLTDGGYVYEQH